MPADEHANDPLLTELERIGREQRSLDPRGLVDYEHLLSCPAVTSLAGVDATRARRALYARDAILDAIATINNETTKRTAEIVLCAAPDFVGRSVTSRKALKTKGISNATFTRHRRPALCHIVRYLRSDPSSLLTGQAVRSDSLRGTPPRRVARTFDALLQAASELHYASLAYAFIESFNGRLARDNILTNRPLDVEIAPEVVVPCYEELKARKRHFGGTYLTVKWSFFDIWCHELRDPYMTWLRSNLPDRQRTDLIFYMSTIVAGVGYDVHERRAIRESVLRLSEPTAGERTDEDLAQDAMPISRALARWDSDLLLADGKPAAFTSAEMLAAKTAAILHLATALPALSALDHADSERHDANIRDRICDHYSFIPGELVVDEMCLSEAIDAYFEDVSERLAAGTAARLDCRSHVDEDLLPWSQVSLAD